MFRKTIGGIVAEYNPFHFGHLYQLRDFKEKSQCGYTVAIMSGSFVQRGEPAIYDKFSRAKAAVNSGIDLVIELPVYYSLSNAEHFAMGAISLLSELKADCIGFGSEVGSISDLNAAAEKILVEAPEISSKIKEELALGVCYPKALCNALKPTVNINTPNAVLGIQYIKAAKLLGYAPDFFITQRKGSSHDSQTINPFFEFECASNLRKQILLNQATSKYMDCSFYSSKRPATLDLLSQSVAYAIRTKSIEELSDISEVTEGLENLIKKAANESSSIEDIMFTVKSKRYTLAKIKRILLCTSLGITKAITEEKPSYIHVLACKRESLDLLNEISMATSLPIVFAGRDINKLTDKAKGLFCYDAFATALYSQISDIKPNADYCTKALIL